MPRITQKRLEAVRERIVDIATYFRSDPTSRRGNSCRHGTHGSLAVDRDNRVYFDHEAGVGGDAIHLIQREKNLDFRDAVFFGEKLLGLYSESNGAGPQKARRRSSTPRTAKNNPRGVSREALAVWNSALPLAGSMGAVYLESVRHCGIPGHNCCRFVPALKHWSSNQKFPCIVSLVTDVVTGAPLTLHMTFLAHDGRAKAPVERPRLFWAGLPSGGGVVRLSPDDQVEIGLIIPESLECGQSLLDHGMAPVWACLGSGTMGSFPVLGGIEALTICADADDAGRQAAQKCMERWTAAGREVTVTYPYGTAKDFNEVAVSRADQ